MPSVSVPSVSAAGIPAVRPLLAAAPMAEITDSAFRTMCFRHGADLCVTEMVSAAGIYRHSPNTLPLLARLPEETGPTFVQLYGSDPKEMAYAAAFVTDLGRFQGIDLNAGCPAPKVLRCGGGAALLMNPALIGELVSAIAKSTALPVSLKTRIGPNPETPIAAELARIAQESGASLLVMHGRFATARHAGPVQTGLLRNAVEAVRIPVVANGGIQSARDAVELLDATGAAGVMPARGTVGNPWLFREIREMVGRTLDGPRPSLRDEVRTQLRLTLAGKRLALESNPALDFDADEAVALDFRHHLFAYFKGLPGAGELRRRLNDLHTEEDILRAIAEIWPD